MRRRWTITAYQASAEGLHAIRIGRTMTRRGAERVKRLFEAVDGNRLFAVEITRTRSRAR